MAYAPFGEDYAGSGTADVSYTGQNQDTAAKYYDFLFREYSHVAGRWMSPDPAGLDVANAGNPQSWNRYSYALNDSLRLVDPFGLETCELHELNYYVDGVYQGTDTYLQCTGEEKPKTAGGTDGGKVGGGGGGGGGGGDAANNTNQQQKQNCLNNYNNSATGKATKFFSLYTLATDVRNSWKEWTLYPFGKIAAFAAIKHVSQAIGNTEFLSVTGETSTIVTAPAAVAVDSSEAALGPVAPFAIGGATLVDIGVHVQCNLDPTLPPEGVPVGPK